MKSVCEQLIAIQGEKTLIIYNDFPQKTTGISIYSASIGIVSWGSDYFPKLQN